MTATESPTVLVIDDEADLRELLSDTLAAEGVRVATAATGAEALQRARQQRPDLLVADVRLPDGSGLDALDTLRRSLGPVPAVVITGLDTPDLAASVYQRESVAFMTKPLDLPRLRHTVHQELSRVRRATRRRELTRRLNHDRRRAKKQLNTTCNALTTAYQSLSKQLSRQEELIRFQQFLLGCECEDDVFRGLFRFFSQIGGPLFGLALVCDRDAQLQLVGRFGVPLPDDLELCHRIAAGLTEVALNDPQVLRIEANEHPALFGQDLLDKMPGTTFLSIPLLPAAGQMIGLAILYRRGEQPFTDDEVNLAGLIAPSLAMSVQKLAAAAMEDE